MISSVAGTVCSVQAEAAVVEVGGVGLLVRCSPSALAELRVGVPARLATSLVVREDSLTLYGFAQDEERNLFELLQTASGVGPRLAQAVMATLSPQDVRTALANGDIATLTKVPGVGRKGAQRLVLELRERVGVVVGDLPGPRTGMPETGRLEAGSPGWAPQVMEALVGLGWHTRDAEPVVAALVTEERAGSSGGSRGGTGGGSQAEGEAGTDKLAEMIRRALSMVGRPT